MKKVTILLLSLLLAGAVHAQFLQTDWSGGGGQAVFNDPSMFNLSYDADYSSSPGDVIANNAIKAHVYGVTDYNGKLLVSTAWCGTFIYDPATGNWEYSHISPMIHYKNTTVHTDGKLYVRSGYTIYCYDGTYNDYGMGPNGWELHSDIKNYLSASGSAVYTIESEQGRLMIGCRVGYSARVIEWNESSQSWVQMGNSFTNGVCALKEYNGTIYAGTHWNGYVYKWTGSSWVVAFDTPSMSIVDLEVHDGYLFAAGAYNDTKGRLYKYDGNTNQLIHTFYGARIHDLEAHNDVITFTLRPPKPYSSSFGIKQYDGNTVSTLYNFNGESFSNQLCSFQGDLYYGGIAQSYTSNVTSMIYKNGQDFESIYAKGICSSEFPAASGLLNVDATVSNGNGVKVFIQGKNNPTYYMSPWVEVQNGSTVSVTEDYMRYWTILYTIGEGGGPTLHEISIGLAPPPDPLVLSIVSQTDVSCFSGNDGSVEVEADDGTPPYTYDLNGVNTNTSSSLSAGTYIISVTDANGEFSTVEAVISEPDPVNAYAGEDALVYYGYDPMASTQLSASGGITYSWSPAVGLDDPDIANPVASPTETTLYTVTVTDQDGCSNTDEVLVEVMDVRCGNNMNKVLVCHNDKTICISENAVAAHLNHGDYLGYCNGMEVLGIPEDENTVLGLNVFPNPYQRDCQIELTTYEPASLSIQIYDSQGRLHASVFEGNVPAGTHSYHYNDHSSANIKGIYLLRIICNSEIKTIRLLRN